jgi:hypothetical protein
LACVAIFLCQIKGNINFLGSLPILNHPISFVEHQAVMRHLIHGNESSVGFSAFPDIKQVVADKETCKAHKRMFWTPNDYLRGSGSGMEAPAKESSGLVFLLFSLNWNRASVDPSPSSVKTAMDPLGPSGNPRLTNRFIAFTKPSF